MSMKSVVVVIASTGPAAKLSELEHGLTPEQLERKIKKIMGYQLLPPANDWEDGLNTGLDWAVRVLVGDKSAD